MEIGSRRARECGGRPPATSPSSWSTPSCASSRRAPSTREDCRWRLVSELLVAAALAGAPQAAEPVANAAVIVHPEVQVSEMSPRSIAEVFMARRQRWADRSLITLVLTTGEETLHRAFC